MDHLYAKTVGCGHPDTSKWEFATNIQRDSLASHVGHYSRLAFMAGVENESIARTRIKFLEKMVQPCGPPPRKDADV
jgi:splicing factor 3B subunit 5